MSNRNLMTSMLLFDLMTSMLPSLFTWARIGTLDLRHSGIGNHDPQSCDYDGSKPRPSAVKLARLLD